MSDKDTITKEYMQDPKLLADAFNYPIYNGRQIIRPEDLHELDTMMIIDLPDENKVYPELDQKYHDVIKLMTAMADKMLSTLYSVWKINLSFIIPCLSKTCFMMQ